MFRILLFTACVFQLIGIGISQISQCNTIGRFPCSDGVCVSRAKVCNGVMDCWNGEDEENCAMREINRCTINSIWASSNGYDCKKRKCNTRRDCRGQNKQCVCDDECGLSCINPFSICLGDPPRINHTIGFQVLRAMDNYNGSKRFRPVIVKPYYHGDVVTYICEEGRSLVGPLPRCNGHRVWSNEVPECVDFAKCGQAGDSGSFKKRPIRRRSAGGKAAAENAWPWQVLITRNDNSPERSLRQVEGGGSILNKKWILTAAHLLNEHQHRFSYHQDFVISVGIFSRPTRRLEKMKKTIKMYAIADYIPHEAYSNEYHENYEHDIALIKIGARLDENMQETLDVDGLEFGYYIRPVCLPCTGTCLTEEQLVDEHGRSLITPDMNEEEKCLIEEKLLLPPNAKVVITGFGHMNVTWISGYDVSPSRNLRQALLRVEEPSRCKRAIEKIKEYFRFDTFQFSENMICFKSGVFWENVAACKGDSGGPLVREVKYGVNKSCWIQVGIVSFGYGCGTDIPGFYTNVARYIPWILPKIKKTSEGGDDS